jgi:hypothetical protein
MFAAWLFLKPIHRNIPFALSRGQAGPFGRAKNPAADIAVRDRIRCVNASIF